MDRLTHKDEFGAFLVLTDEYSALEEAAINRLAEYEDTGLTPKEIMEMEAEWCALKQKQAEVNSIGIYDEEEIIENATVQIWRNSVTGEESIGWWRGTKEDMPGGNGE